MGAEQVARDLVSNMTDVEKTKAKLTPDAIASGGILPQPLPAMEAFGLVGALKAGFPDIKYEPLQVTVNGDKARVKFQMTGTQTGPLSLPIPGLPATIPPSGKKVKVEDVFVVTVQGDKISHLEVDSPADGGIPAILTQLGVKM